MAFSLSSRFAVLSVDDDSKNRGQNTSKKPIGKQPPKQKQDLKKKNSKPNQNHNQLQTAKPKNKKKKADIVTEQQWESWIEKDKQFVEGNYENQLQEAILLSKLDFEEKMDVYENIQKETSQEKKNVVKKKKGNKTITTMSLNDFNNMDAPENLQQEVNGGGDSNSNFNGLPENPDPEFFERVSQEAKKVYTQEKAKDKKKAKEPYINDAIMIAQLQDQVEKKDKEIDELKMEVARLKDELQSVRTRNKSLCKILGQGEMRDKAELLVQVDKLQAVEDELSNEVQRLNGLLEQERSKVCAFTNDKSKGKAKKTKT